MIFLLGIVATSNSYAKKKKGKNFLFSVTHDATLTSQVKQNSFMYVFEDGSYYFKTNTGDFSFCQDSGPGEFKGKFNNKELESYLKMLDEISKNCSKMSGCHANEHYKKNIATFAIQDLRSGKKKIYTFSSNVLPKMVSHVLKKVKSLKKSPVSSLSIKHNKKEKKISFMYKGEGDIQLQLTEEDFLVQTKSGSILPAKDFISFKGPTSTKLYSSRVESVFYKIKKNRKQVPTHLIHTTEPGAHHLDPDWRIYYNCVEL